MSRPRCENKRCHALMEERPGPFGRLDFVCVPCERVKSGRCCVCAQPITKKPHSPLRYCPSCKAKRERAADHDRYWHGGKREKDVARQAARRDDPVIYADMIEKQRKRQRKTKRDDLDRLYHRVHAKARRNGAPRVTVDRRPQLRTAA